MLRVVVAILLLAALAGLCYVFSASRDFVPWIVALATGLAAMLAGGTIGLLFAVPRRDANAATSSSGYSGNDNLVKVSDWLTGALTGIALATARDISDAVWLLCLSILNGYPGFALACIVGGFASGFLMAYLRLRASLPFIFATFDKRASEVTLQFDLAREKEARNREGTRSRSVEAVALSAEPETFLAGGSSKVQAVRKAMSNVYHGDPNKGQFGGSSQGGAYLLSMSGYHVGEEGMLRADLEVASSNRSQPLTQATFHLHPSFPAPVISKPSDPDGVVRTSVWMFETFTVGVIAEPGQVPLELDLSSLTVIPDEYR